MDARRMPIGVMVGAPLLIGLGVFAFTTEEPVPDPGAPDASATAGASVTPGATATNDIALYTPPAGIQTGIAEQWATQTAEAMSPTATPVVGQRGDFRDGAWVRVNAGAGDCLNARNQPSVASDWVIVQTCLPDGFQGMITGNAAIGEDRWWWYLAGAGWVAEEYLAYVRDIDLSQPQAPALAGLGRIAYIRDGDIWMMDADGGNQRMIIDTPDDATGSSSQTSELRWSPDGTMLSYNVHSYANGASSTTLHVAWIALDGRVLRSEAFERTLGGGWSPDSTKIAILGDAGRREMGVSEGTPGTLELTTGLRSVFDSTVQFYVSTPEFNHDGTKLLYQHPGTPANDPAGGPPIEAAHVRIADTDGAEITRIPIPANSWISQPHWSPVEDRIAFHLSDGGDPSYAVYDLAQARVVQRVPVPRTSDRIGGRCGGSDMWRLDWNREGTAILYSFSDGDTGANGVWTWDLATNTTRVTFAASAGAASPGGDGRFVFSASDAGASHMFWAREGDPFPAIIAEGWAPVWAP